MSQINIAVSTQTGAAEGNLTRLESKIETLEAAMKDTGVASVRAAQAAEGSFASLEKELKQNESALKRLSVGSKEFENQRDKVDKLRMSVVNAKKELAGNVADQSGASGLVDQFTSSLSGTVATIASVGTIAASLRQDLENIQKKRENERLAEVDFGAALGARTIGNLAPEERSAVKPLALNVAEDLGLNPGAVVEAIGELRSSGAESILEAADYLKEAVKAFPQDLASARSIARAALIESAATGNRNAAEVIGGTVQAQSVSLTKNPEEFAKAFGSNIASAVSIQKVTPEQAREEASIFTLLETRGAEVAADAQRSFMTQISNFVPKEEKQLKAGGVTKLDPADVSKFLAGSFTERQSMLENNSELRKQFFDGLQETGRSAITRRLQPTEEDSKIIKGVQQNITTDDAAAKLLRQQQEQAGVAAAFAIAQGQRQAQKTTSEIRTNSKEKLTAELELTQESIRERTETGFGGSAKGKFEEFGSYVEEMFSGDSRGEVLENTVRFKAQTSDDPFAQQQLARIEQLKAQIAELDAMNQAGDRNLAAMQGQAVVAVQPAAQPQVEVKPPVDLKPQAEAVNVEPSPQRQQAAVVQQAKEFTAEFDSDKDGRITPIEGRRAFGSGRLSQENIAAIGNIEVPKGTGSVSNEQMQRAIIDTGGLKELIAESKPGAVVEKVPERPMVPAVVAPEQVVTERTIERPTVPNVVARETKSGAVVQATPERQTEQPVSPTIVQEIVPAEPSGASVEKVPERPVVPVVVTPGQSQLTVEKTTERLLMPAVRNEGAESRATVQATPERRQKEQPVSPTIVQEVVQAEPAREVVEKIVERPALPVVQETTVEQTVKPAVVEKTPERPVVVQAEPSRDTVEKVTERLVTPVVQGAKPEPPVKPAIVEKTPQRPIVQATVQASSEAPVVERIVERPSTGEKKTDRPVGAVARDPKSERPVVEKITERQVGPVVRVQEQLPASNRSALKRQNADEANDDLTENKSGRTRPAGQDRGDNSNAALLAEQNRLMKEQNELLRQQNQRPPQRPPAPVPVSVKVQAPATRPKESPLPERLQP
jgi:hypothetical protein